MPAAGFTHKACLACIILALEIVYDKDHCDSRQYRGLIEGALTRLGKFSKISVSAVSRSCLWMASHVESNVVG